MNKKDIWDSKGKGRAMETVLERRWPEGGWENHEPRQRGPDFSQPLKHGLASVLHVHVCTQGSCSNLLEERGELPPCVS